MSELKRGSSEVVKTIAEQGTAWVRRGGNDKQARTAVSSVASPYDALDYRLMATFPASDAVAQY